MKRLLWLVTGVALGFAIAHQVNRTPEGRRVFDAVNARVQEFVEGVAAGYRAREAELREAAEATAATERSHESKQ